VPVSRLAVISLGGVLGALGRYALALALPFGGPGHWPMATFLANVAGCLAIGFLATSARVARAPEWVRPFAITGILGGFTTFSAFALESGVLFDAGYALLAMTYIVATMAVGLVAVRLGAWLAEQGGSP
jgi:CrcB protein